ncbi:hypothetical protein BDZ88DRAFT_482579 [Geranomyces variabilis]|nr:hypothetical protein BDZ88DRAFT_482579 [Geranomyces variabilis]KAJ3136411.1 Coiled-coil domain-containing protein 13 [Geranomyces variabilis]
MIATAAPTRAPAQPSTSTLPYLCKTGSTSVLAANNARRLRYNEDDDSDAEDAVAGPALAAEDMGLDLDEELEQTIFGTSGQDSSARHPGRRKQDNKTKKAIPTTAAPQPSAPHEYALRLKELEHVNSQLRATLLLSSQEVKALRQEALEQSMSGGAADDGGEIGEMGAREAKLILLAKKARRLTVALERERTQNTALSNKLKMQLEAKPAAAPVPARDTRDETKALRDKLGQVTRKLEEERTAAQALRAEVRNMHLALRKEIGEEMPLSQILDASSGWKGRAQQIITLKAKIQTLLANSNSNSSGAAANCTVSPGPGSGAYDSSHRAAIRRIETERKVAMEVSASELEETRRSLEDAKRKCDAVTARNRLLEQSLRQHKRDIETLVRKAGTDDRLIAALRAKSGKQATPPKLVDSSQCSACASRALLPIGQTTPQLQASPPPSPTFATLSAAANASTLQLENTHLHELRSALETRAFNAAAQIADLTADLARERRRTGKDKANGPPASSSDEAKTIDTSLIAPQLHEKLALLSDENAALRTTLRATQETTREEIEIFSNLLKKSREGFQRDLEAIARHVQKQLGEHGEA